MMDRHECKGSNFFNRYKWHYPNEGWSSRICTGCGQPQEHSYAKWRNCSMLVFVDSVNKANERILARVNTRELGLKWLKENKVI